MTNLSGSHVPVREMFYVRELQQVTLTQSGLIDRRSSCRRSYNQQTLPGNRQPQKKQCLVLATSLNEYVYMIHMEQQGVDPD